MHFARIIQKKLTSILVRHTQSIFVLMCGLYALLTLSAIFTTDHVLYNLEPYPDGLLYALSARNLILSGKLALLYSSSEISFWVPPVYSLLLSIGYLFWSAPEAFYVVNVLIGIGSCILLWRTIYSATKNSLLALLGLCWYLMHAYIVWLPTIPMTENLSLFFMVLSLYGLINKSNSRLSMLSSCIGIIGMTATRYSLVLPAGILLLWWTWRVIKTQPTFIVVRLFTTCGLLITSLALFFHYNDQNISATLHSLYQQLVYSNGYYSVSNSGNHILFYLNSIFGMQTRFLWLTHPLTTHVLSLFAVSFLFVGIVSLPNKQHSLWLSAVVLAHFPLLLVFYVADARYIITLIPLFIISSLLIFNEFIQRYSQYTQFLTMLVIVITLCHLYVQIPFHVQILSSNFAHTAKAWQFEAVQEFNRFSSTQNKEITIITALPPFLISAYQTSSYTVLPLSEHQEFIAKREQAWGEGVPLTELRREYAAWLKQGKKLYISNAYITHQQSVIDDFEAYKSMFTLRQVSEGCYSACNIYELQLRTQ